MNTLYSIKVNNTYSGAFCDEVFYTKGTASMVIDNIKRLYKNSGIACPKIEVIRKVIV